MIADVAAAVCTSLRADAPLMAAFNDAVFTDLAPLDTEPPFCVVRLVGAEYLVEGAPTWDRVALQFDVIGQPDGLPELLGLAGAVRDHVEALRGATLGAVRVQAVGTVSAVFGFDPTVTPPLPRWVLTAGAVVRGIEEGVAR